MLTCLQVFHFCYVSDFAQIASIMSSNIRKMNTDAVYATKEFEETFWKIMTGLYYPYTIYILFHGVSFFIVTCVSVYIVYPVVFTPRQEGYCNHNVYYYVYQSHTHKGTDHLQIIIKRCATAMLKNSICLLICVCFLLLLQNYSQFASINKNSAFRCVCRCNPIKILLGIVKGHNIWNGAIILKRSIKIADSFFFAYI